MPGALAQLGERRLCKPEVTGSIPVRSIALRSRFSCSEGRPSWGGRRLAGSVQTPGTERVSGVTAAHACRWSRSPALPLSSALPFGA
jgi:hypothetical protein